MLRYGPTGLKVYNDSDYSIFVRDEDWTLYEMPAHCVADISPDGVQNPQTDDWTKFRGGKWWLLAFGPMRNDVYVAPNGQSFCFSGQCASPYIPNSTGSTRLTPWRPRTVNDAYQRRPNEPAPRHPSTTCDPCRKGS